MSLGLHLMFKLSTSATRLILIKSSASYHSRSPSPPVTQYIQFLVLPRLPLIPALPQSLGRARAGMKQQWNKQWAAILEDCSQHLGSSAENGTDKASQVKL